jgi:hypothetical protein
VRNRNLPRIVCRFQQTGSQTMFKRNKLLVRIPFLMEAAAEGTLAVVLLFALVLATAAIFVILQQ